MNTPDVRTPVERGELAGQPAASPVPYGDQPHQTLHPDLVERMLRQMWQEARPLFGYFLNQAMGVEPKAPTSAQRHGAPDRQGGAK